MATMEKVVLSFNKQYHETGTIARRLGSGRPSLVTAADWEIVEEHMLVDNETTSINFTASFIAKGCQ